VKKNTRGGAPASVIYDDVLGHVEQPHSFSLYTFKKNDIRCWFRFSNVFSYSFCFLFSLFFFCSFSNMYVIYLSFDFLHTSLIYILTLLAYFFCVLSIKEEPVPESLLDKIDGLQVIGKPNSWVYPDDRLNLSRFTDEAGRKVDAVTVQLTSATFSFQVVSARLGWPLRIYPKNAKPKFGMHASEDGVLKKSSPSAIECAASDGSIRKGAGHGHNFHIVENTNDVVTIFVAREMKPQYDEYASVDKMSMNEAQLEQVYYQVWYELAGEGESAKFMGGDGIDISKSKRFSLGNSSK
jgi:hypothetical protein